MELTAGLGSAPTSKEEDKFIWIGLAKLIERELKYSRVRKIIVCSLHTANEVPLKTKFK